MEVYDVNGHQEIDRLAGEVERAIQEFDEALARHERARSDAPSYGDATSIWERVKDELHG